VPKHVDIDICHNWCVTEGTWHMIYDCKNKHGMNKKKLAQFETLSKKFPREIRERPAKPQSRNPVSEVRL
jgi:hypothetical protein